MKFETERLQIRECVDSDIEYLYNLLSDSEVMKYCGGALGYAESQSWLESIKKYYNKLGYDYWLAFEKKTGEFIGQIGIIQQEVDGKSIDCIAFMISKDKWGKGYAVEGGNGCIKYALEVLKLKKLYATVEKENTASKKVLKSIGMNYEREAICFNRTVDLYSNND